MKPWIILGATLTVVACLLAIHAEYQRSRGKPISKGWSFGLGALALLSCVIIALRFTRPALFL